MIVEIYHQKCLTTRESNLVKKVGAGQSLSINESYILHDVVLIGRNVSKCLVQIFTQIQLSYNWK